MAQFALPPGQVSHAVAPRTVEEFWFIVEGHGLMWRKTSDVESVVDLRAVLSLTIPVGTAFQFRCDVDVALKAVGVTMPPWPGMDEAYEVAGKWWTFKSSCRT